MIRRDALSEYARGSLWVLPTLSVAGALAAGSLLSVVNVGVRSPLAFQAHPGWTANLLAGPAAAIEIGPERIRVTAELAGAATQSRVWPRFLSIYPGYGHYANRRDVPPRMFLLHPHDAADPDAGHLA